MNAQVRHGIAWSAVNSLVLRLGTFSVGIVLARILTPEEFGVYAVALTIQAVLITLADMGLSADLIRSNEPERRAPTVGTLGLATGSVLAVGMALTAQPLASVMGSPDSGSVIVLLSVTLFLGGAGVVPNAFLIRDFRQKALFFIAVVDFVISSVLVVVLVLNGWGPISLAIGRVAAQTVTLVLQFFFARTRPRYGWDRELAGSVLAFGLPIAGANCLSWVLINVDNVVIARVAGPVALGFYVLAFNIASWPMSAIGQVVRSVALPMFSRNRGIDGDGLTPAARATWALALPAGGFLAVLAPPLVLFVYGARWAPSASVLAALGVFGALRVVFDLMVAYLLARGEARVVLYIQVLWFVVLLPAMILGTRWFGIQGGGWAHVVVAILVVLPAYLWAVHKAGCRLPHLTTAMLPPMLAMIPAAGAAFATSRSISSPSLALTTGGLVGGVVFVALLASWLPNALRSATGDTESQPHAPHHSSDPIREAPMEGSKQ